MSNNNSLAHTKWNCKYHMMSGSKGLLPPTDDTQHAHFMCKVLLNHSQLSSFFVKNDYVARVLGGHKGIKNHASMFFIPFDLSIIS